MATYKGPIAGAELLQLAIDRTVIHLAGVRASRSGRPSVDRYNEQRLNSFSYQAEERELLLTLEKLKNGLR
jgi:hypothetical protein